MSSKAYAYSRYSSSAQGSGDSLKRQLKSATEFADKHGLELDTTLRDLGVSAFKGDHRIKGALGSFIKAVEEGEVERGSYLLVDSMDRLSRESETEVLHLLTGLTRQGIKVVNVSEEHVLDETAKMMDYMRVLIHASRSNLESEEKGRKVKSARIANKERARNNLQRWHKTGPAWLSGEAFGQREDRYVVFTPISYAFIRLDITSTLNPDAFVEASRLVIGKRVSCLGVDIGDEETFEDGSTVENTGGFTTITQGRMRFGRKVTISHLREADYYTNWRPFMAAAGQTNPFLFIANDDPAYPYMQQQVMFARINTVGKSIALSSDQNRIEMTLLSV